MANDDLFIEKAPLVMFSLIDQFGLDEIQAAGVLGNIGHECAGFNNLREIGQPEGKGGYGWCQWTGARAKTFLKFCEDNGADWQSDDANAAYLFFELQGSERGAIAALEGVTTLEEAVIAFEAKFERAGVKHYPSRNRYAQLAYDTYQEVKDQIEPQSNG